MIRLLQRLDSRVTAGNLDLVVNHHVDSPCRKRCISITLDVDCVGRRRVGSKSIKCKSACSRICGFVNYRSQRR
jgi:hypothetical protein